MGLVRRGGERIAARVRRIPPPADGATNEPRGTAGRAAAHAHKLLTYAQRDDSVAALAEAARREPQRAFVSASLARTCSRA